MLKFLHTADWQIGRQFGRFDADDGAMLAAARLEAVARIAELAEHRQVNAVLVAGDIFDTQTISDKLLRRTFQAMAAYRGYWFLLPGNHDAALADGVWRRAQEFGLLTDQVVLLNEPVPYVNDDWRCVLLPAPLTQRQTMQDLTTWFDDAETPDGYCRIGLAHGSISGRLPEPADTMSNPIAPDRASRARLDYLALGDWHGCLAVNERVWYSGTPEADRFRSNNPGQVLEVNLPAAGSAPDVVQHQVGQFHWHRFEIALTATDSLQSLADACRGLDTNAVVRLKLSGLISWAQTRALRETLATLQARVAALDADTTDIGLLPADIEMSSLVPDGYLGDVLAKLRDEVADDVTADPVKRQALAILAEAVITRQSSKGER